MTRRVLPRISLGMYPTPITKVERGAPPLWLSEAELLVKRDDATSEVYGGNKVRKLELFLGAAREADKKRILTLGAVGSHQVLAAAIFGAREGFEVDAVLVPQPYSEHAIANLRAALHAGLHAHAATAWALAPLVVATKRSSDAYWVPLGGSNVLGTIAYVEAADELALQVERGELPEPDVVVVALGSGGTAAGLAVGFEARQMKTKVVGVAISHPIRALSVAAHHLARKTALHLGMSSRAASSAAKRLEIDGSFCGRGYGHATAQGAAATEAAARSGLVLDPTYTAKAFACALDRARAPGSRACILMWLTLSHVLPAAGDPVPEALERLLRRSKRS